MTTTPPPVPVHLATDAMRHTYDQGVLLFVVAAPLLGVAALGETTGARRGETMTLIAR